MSESNETRFGKKPAAVRVALKKEAIRLWRHGLSYDEICAELGLSTSTLTKAVSAWKKDHRNGLAMKKMGRPVGACKVLPPDAEAKVLSMVADHAPCDYGIDAALWSRDSVQSLVQERLGIRIGLTTVGLYLRRWGLAIQMPAGEGSGDGHARKAPESPETNAFGNWMREVKALARKKGADVFFVVERPFRKGAPSKDVQALNMVGAVNSLGTAKFSLCSGSIDSDAFIDYARRLLQDVKRPVVLVVDGQLAHRSAKTRKWIGRNAAMVSLRFLQESRPADGRRAAESAD